MLFRPEVIRNHRSARLGGIAISQPLGVWLLTLAATGMAAVIVAFLLLGSYTRRASVAGQLVPLQGVVTLPAPVTRIVERLDAAEGDAASAEQTLAIIQAPRAMPESGNGGAALEQQIRQQKASLKAAQDAQQQQLRQQASGLNEQLQAARRELLQIEAEAATRQRQTRLAREKLARYQSLEKAGAVSVQEQQSAVFEHEAQTQTLLRQAASTRRLLAQLEQALRELPSQRAAARANHARDMAQLEQSEVQVRMDNRLAVTAPVAGVIAAQLVRQGQAVQAGQPLLSLLPGQGTLQAHLLAPSRAVGFIEPGDKVMLRYQAYPYQKFGHHTGRVASISRSALTRSELQALSSVYQNLFRVWP
ncbi:HlyD family secretion protein [Ottowia sp. oral taxon 894]|uniref:HlyD family secretion protein n=1 Tax=Ottowia sp. oral taxon 894 TaxID=1658672 RepID=UPI000681122E|nr:HlyD family efflux transporter periplasmic adaptor subunit [Ottowia sp. oral taxon 894]